MAKTDLDTQRNQVAQFESAVAANDASMRAAQVQLQYTRVTAPITGIAGIRAVDAGNVVSAGTALVTLTQIHPIHVVFNLPERQLPDVRTAQQAGPVTIAALDRNDSHVLTDGGKLDVVDNQISSDSGTFRARALFDNTDNSLWPGQFVNVRMQLRTIGGGVVIPTQAVMRGPDGEYVYIVQARQHRGHADRARAAWKWATATCRSPKASRAASAWSAKASSGSSRAARSPRSSRAKPRPRRPRPNSRPPRNSRAVAVAAAVAVRAERACLTFPTPAALPASARSNAA